MKEKIIFKEKGSLSIYGIIISLIVLQLILFARILLNENFEVSLAKLSYTMRKIEAEELERQTKLISHMLLERAVFYSLENADFFSENEELASEEEVSAVYNDSIERYLSQNIQVDSDDKPSARDLSYLKGNIENGSQYHYTYSDFSVKAEIIESNTKSKRVFKKYRISYVLKDKDENLSQNLSTVYLVVKYPTWTEAKSKNLKYILIETVKENS